MKLLHFFLVLTCCLYYASAWSKWHPTRMAGNRTTIVQMFEWRFDDLADECERFLGPKGYGAIQVSPVHEHIVQGEPKKYAWWQRYQVVSYKLTSRSGNKDQLENMVRRCNNVGVRTYVDIIPNHMTGGGKGVGSGGTSWDGDTQQYPGVPYSREHFNMNIPGRCPTWHGGIENWGSAQQNRNCMLVGLRDLDQGQPYVRTKIAEAFNELIDIGIAGFRIDAMKHMWPGDMELLWKEVKPLRSDIFGHDTWPFMYHEIAWSEGEIHPSQYTHLGRPIEFRYLNGLQDTIKGRDGKKLAYLRNYGRDWGFLPDEDAVAIVDNHDVQRAANGQPNHVIMFRNYRWHKMITAFMLAWPYGVTKVISSYDWQEYIVDGKDANYWMGPPSHPDGTTKNVKILPDGTCDEEWVCEHRWRQIFNMVQFRNVVGNAPVAEWWDNGSNHIAFSRRGRGFFAMNNDNHNLSQRRPTGLPSGVYCDIISGELIDGRCTGKELQVDSQGYVDLFVPHDTDGVHQDSMVAIHVEAKLR